MFASPSFKSGSKRFRLKWASVTRKAASKTYHVHSYNSLTFINNYNMIEDNKAFNILIVDFDRDSGFSDDILIV